MSNYVNALSQDGYDYIEYAFRRMLEDCINKDELLDMLLGCQAGQALASFALAKANANDADRDLFVYTAPAVTFEEEENWQILSIYGDRSVSYSVLNDPAEIWLDIECFIANRPALFKADNETLRRPFGDLTYYRLGLPERFTPRTVADFLTTEQIRAALLTGECRFFQIFNNRLLIQNEGEDFYRDMGAVADEIFVEEIYYEIRIERAAFLESQGQSV